MLPHNKIIKTTVKKFLEPENLFQIGSSRSWLDDQGYYMILVEFASSGYSKGASLDAGVSFLWESKESLYSLDEITEIFCKLGLRICNSFADFSGKPSSDNDIQLMVYSIRE